MLIALIHGQPGVRRTAALALLSLSTLFAVGLFGAQLAAPNQFGCTFFGADFAHFYLSSKLILAGQGISVYDPPQRKEAGDAFTREHDLACSVVPTIWWLAFLAPVLPLTLLAPVTAYYAWTVLSIALLLFGLWRLARESGVPSWRFWLITMGFLPVVVGLLQGQVHGWQLFALVEFWLAQRRQAERAAGLWFSLQLVKPQFLPLPLIYLIWRRRWRAFGWFIAGGLFWLGVSIWLAGGIKGVTAHAQTMTGTMAPLDARIVNAGAMVNWRAFALIYFGTANPLLTGAVVAVLSLLTVGLVVWAWRREPTTAVLAPRSFLVLMTASLLIGYDTHSYSAVLLLPPLLLFIVEITKTSGRPTGVWSILLDFAVVSPSLLTALAFLVLPSSLTIWVMPNQALLFGLIGILLTGVFLPHLGESGYGDAPSHKRTTRDNLAPCASR